MLIPWGICAMAFAVATPIGMRKEMKWLEQQEDAETVVENREMADRVDEAQLKCTLGMNALLGLGLFLTTFSAICAVISLDLNYWRFVGYLLVSVFVVAYPLLVKSGRMKREQPLGLLPICAAAYALIMAWLTF